MKNTLFLLIVFILLAGAAYFFVFRRENTTINRSETEFAVKDTAGIDKIIITGKSGKQLILERTVKTVPKSDTSGTDTLREWRVNNLFRARKRQTDMLLETFYSLVMKAPVNKNARENVIKEMDEKAVRIEIFSKGKNIKTLLSGGTDPDAIVTYMRLEGAINPYAVELPNFTGYLNPRFTTDILDWRDKTIFNQDPVRAEKLSMRYTGNSKNSYELINKNSKWYFKENEVEENTMRTLLDNLRRSEVEYYTTEKSRYIADSLITTNPYCIFETNFRNGSAKKITFYNRETQPDSIKGRDWNPDRYWGFIDENAGELVSLQHFTFRDILVSGEKFSKGK